MFTTTPVNSRPPITQLNWMTYAWDATGNRVAGGRVIGTNNQLLADGQFTYTWDAEGNISSRTRTSDGAVTRYQYDHRNRLTSVTEETAAAVITRSSTMTYDAFDRRIARTVDLDGAGSALPDTTTFAYDGQHIWLDGDANGGVTARYLYGEEIDDLLAQHRPIDGTARYLTDQVGSGTSGRGFRRSDPESDHIRQFRQRTQPEQPGVRGSVSVHWSRV